MEPSFWRLGTHRNTPLRKPRRIFTPQSLSHCNQQIRSAFLQTSRATSLIDSDDHVETSFHAVQSLASDVPVRPCFQRGQNLALHVHALMLVCCNILTTTMFRQFSLSNADGTFLMQGKKRKVSPRSALSVFIVRASTVLGVITWKLHAHDTQFLYTPY